MSPNANYNCFSVNISLDCGCCWPPLFGKYRTWQGKPQWPMSISHADLNKNKLVFSSFSHVVSPQNYGVLICFPTVVWRPQWEPSSDSHQCLCLWIWTSNFDIDSVAIKHGAHKNFFILPPLLCSIICNANCFWLLLLRSVAVWLSYRTLAKLS